MVISVILSKVNKVYSLQQLFDEESKNVFSNYIAHFWNKLTWWQGSIIECGNKPYAVSVWAVRR